MKNPVRRCAHAPMLLYSEMSSRANLITTSPWARVLDMYCNKSILRNSLVPTISVEPDQHTLNERMVSIGPIKQGVASLNAHIHTVSSKLVIIESLFSEDRQSNASKLAFYVLNQLRHTLNVG